MFTIHTKKILFGAMASVMFAGCASTGSTYDSTCTTIPKEKVYVTTTKEGKITQKHVIYHPDPNLKKAVVILTKKVAALESRIAGAGAKLPPVAPVETKCVGCGPKTPVKPKAKKTLPYRDGTYSVYTEVPIWACATTRGKQIGTIKKGITIKLYDCGIYGWCRIQGQEGYVEAWRVKRIGD